MAPAGRGLGWTGLGWVQGVQQKLGSDLCCGLPIFQAERAPASAPALALALALPMPMPLAPLAPPLQRCLRAWSGRTRAAARASAAQRTASTSACTPRRAVKSCDMCCTCSIIAYVLHLPGPSLLALASFFPCAPSNWQTAWPGIPAPPRPASCLRTRLPPASCILLFPARRCAGRQPSTPRESSRRALLPEAPSRRAPALPVSQGEGVVCLKPEGVPSGAFLGEYLGELYTAWRWYERQPDQHSESQSRPRLCSSRD